MSGPAAAGRTCEVCGASTRLDHGRCTNGRCAACHRLHCTPGGDTSPGHARRWPADASPAATLADHLTAQLEEGSTCPRCGVEYLSPARNAADYRVDHSAGHCCAACWRGTR